MASDYVEEELKIMEETKNLSKSSLAAAIDIEDPIKVLDLEQVISAKSNSTLKEVVELLNNRHIGCVTIINESDETIGIFTERDLLRRVAGRGLDFSKEKIDDYMTKNPETLSEEDPIAFALNKMSDGGYRHVPITRAGKVKFMLSVRDIVDQISLTYRKKVLNLPPDPKQQTTQYGG